jgi:hypothetical protein
VNLQEIANRESYCIIRFFYARDFDREVVASGLTLEEAQAHCRDPETNSRTAVSAEAVRRTRERGPWFDGYEQEF